MKVDKSWKEFTSKVNKMPHTSQIAKHLVGVHAALMGVTMQTHTDKSAHVLSQINIPVL